MFTDVLKENNDVFGLDLGASAIRAVQLKKAFGKFELVAMGSAPLPKNIALSDSKIDQETISKVLKDLVHATHIVTKKVITSLPGDSIYTTVVKLPKMPLSEMEKAVKYQAEQNIPLKISEVRIDWQIINETPDKREVYVMLIAAPLTKIEKMLGIIEGAGLEVNVVETNALASARSLQTTEPLYMIADIGAFLTELTVVDSGIVSHNRAMPIGGQAVTRAISQALEIDEDQAEQFKLKFGILPDKLDGQLFKAARPILDNIIEEINRSIKFYYEQYGKNVTIVKIVGGGARVHGLQDYFSQVLGIGIIYGNPWSMVVHKSDTTEKLAKSSLEFSTAVGLAMREL